MPPPLASPIQDSQEYGFLKTPSSHEKEAEPSDVQNQKKYWYSPLFVMLKTTSSSDVAYLLKLSMKRHPQEGLSGAEVVMDGWVGG